MGSGRVVLVTGGGGGIGAEIVRRFLDNADAVIATDRSPQALENLHSRLVEPMGLRTAVADVTSEEDCERLSAGLRRDIGRLDVLVNCAGFFPIAAFEQIDPGDWRDVLEVNLTGTFLMTRATLPLMKGRGWGRIVNIASSSVFSGVAGRAHYVAAKAGVIGLTRSLARELGPLGITVNAVAPGLTITASVTTGLTPERIAGSRSGRAIERDQRPDDVAGPVLFLASPEAGFITGQTLIVDGGKLTR